MGGGGAGIPGADQPVGLVDANMILVAEHRDGEIDRLGCPFGGAQDRLPIIDILRCYQHFL